MSIWSLEELAELINSAVPAVRDAAITAMTGLSVIIDTIRSAVQAAAHATAQALRTLIRMPKFLVFHSVMPSIYAFNLARITAAPPLALLNYNGPRSPITAANRRWVRSIFGVSPAPAGQSLDEYPFASTAQGGPPLATGIYVPRRENSVQGGLLSAFYRFDCGAYLPHLSWSFPFPSRSETIQTPAVPNISWEQYEAQKKFPHFIGRFIGRGDRRKLTCAQCSEHEPESEDCNMLWKASSGYAPIALENGAPQIEGLIGFRIQELPYPGTEAFVRASFLVSTSRKWLLYDVVDYATLIDQWTEAIQAAELR